jgi:hypothetical protein
VLFFRQNVDQRAIGQSREELNIDQNNSGWSTLNDKIGGSGASINMYVYTKSFASDQKFLHLGQFDSADSNIVTNMYGPVDAGNFGQYWGMTSQGMTNIAASTKKRRWTDVQNLGGGVFSAIGRQLTSGTTSNAIHVGLQFRQIGSGQLETNVVWNQSIDDGNNDLIVGETLYGSFDKDSEGEIMVKYFEGQKSNSKIEFWSLASKLDSHPVKHDSQLSTSKLR